MARSKVVGNPNDEAHVTHWMISALSSIALTVAQAAAPDLARTELYTSTVHGCHTLDLSKWTHPVRQVLLDAGAKIDKVELCNENTFPVLTVTLPFDPQGQTDAYYNKLYAQLADANGFWSYALVDTADALVITATVERRKHQVTLNYETFNGSQR